MSGRPIIRYGDTVQTSQSITLDSLRPVLVIDPGHGGEDGGAVAEDGTVESNINLSIAHKVAGLTEMAGWKVCMTRREDISIHDTDAETLHQKKVSDLRNRVALCEEIGDCILISIHQNSFPSAKSVYGAQVFYNEKKVSENLAQIIQDALNQSVNQEKPKEIKSIGQSSYLMKHITCPGVLIECGYLSNQKETQMLKTEAYQKKLALIIASSLIQGIESENYS